MLEYRLGKIYKKMFVNAIKDILEILDYGIEMNLLLSNSKLGIAIISKRDSFTISSNICNDIKIKSDNNIFQKVTHALDSYRVIM